MSDLSAEALAPLANVDSAKWSRLPNADELSAVAAAITARGIRVLQVADAAGARDALAKHIPRGAEVMSGSSTTLNEIGFPAMLKDEAIGWSSYNAKITAENDEKVRADLRRKGVTSEYFVASVNAICKTGELVACDRSGSRVGAFPFAAKNLVIVCGANKIVATLPDALKRLEEYAYPLENERAKKVYNVESAIAKIVILARETIKDRTTLVLVSQRLGY